MNLETPFLDHVWVFPAISDALSRHSVAVKSKQGFQDHVRAFLAISNVLLRHLTAVDSR